MWLRKVFEFFDHDQSGGIDIWELALLLAELGLSNSEGATDKWLAAMDKNHSGTVEWEELLLWWREGGGQQAVKGLADQRQTSALPLDRRASSAVGPGSRPATGVALSQEMEDGLRSLFAYYDADHSGDISLSELTKLLIDLGAISGGDEGSQDDEMDELLAEIEMAEMDTDGNGTISFKELCAWWVKTGRGPPPPPKHMAQTSTISRRMCAQLLS